MKKVLSLLLALAMIFGLAACGTNTDTTTKAPESDSQAPAQTTKDSGTPQTTPAAEVKYKKEVVIGHNVAFDGPDPQTKNNFQNTRIYQLVYDRLIYYNTETQQLEPMLATKWEFDAATLTWTFTLRDDVTFHNGEKFKADDVVFTWERGKESTVSGIKNYYSAIEKMEAVNDTTLKMTLGSPNGDFLYTLTFPYMAVLNRKACTEDPDNGYLIGTGLWKWETHEANDYDSFNRNDNYWGKSTPTEHIIIRLIPEASARLIALQNGEIDICINTSTDELDYVKEDPNLELVSVDTVTLQYFNWNMAHEGPWQDQNFRLAVAHAINWDEFLYAAKNNYAVRATTIWSHAQYGYVKLPGYDYDEALAKEYLAKSTYAGETIKMTGFGAYSKMALIIAGMLNKIGIKTEQNEVNSTTYSTLIKDGEWDSAVYQISFTVPGSDVERLIISSNQGKRSLNGSPHEAEVKERLAKAKASSDDAERKTLYKEVQELLAEDACLIPLCYPTNFTAINKNISGVKWETNTDWDYRYVTLTEE